MKTYTILTIEGNEIPITASEFFAALNTKDAEGKPLYFWYLQGNCNSLLPYCERYNDIIHFIHNDDARIRAALDRLTRCRVPGKNGGLVICKRKCQDCERFHRGERSGITLVPMEIEQDGETREREIADEHTERDLSANLENQELVSRLRSVLADLKDIEREVITLLYLHKHPLSVSACAKALNKNWRTIANARDRAIAKLGTALADFKDFI